MAGDKSVGQQVRVLQQPRRLWPCDDAANRKFHPLHVHLHLGEGTRLQRLPLPCAWQPKAVSAFHTPCVISPHFAGGFRHLMSHTELTYASDLLQAQDAAGAAQQKAGEAAGVQILQALSSDVMVAPTPLWPAPTTLASTCALSGTQTL